MTSHHKENIYCNSIQATQRHGVGMARRQKQMRKKHKTPLQSADARSTRWQHWHQKQNKKIHNTIKYTEMTKNSLVGAVPPNGRYRWGFSHLNLMKYQSIRFTRPRSPEFPQTLNKIKLQAPPLHPYYSRIKWLITFHTAQNRPLQLFQHLMFQVQ